MFSIYHYDPQSYVPDFKHQFSELSLITVSQGCLYILNDDIDDWNILASTHEDNENEPEFHIKDKFPFDELKGFILETNESPGIELKFLR